MENRIDEQLLRDGQAMKTRNIIGIVLWFTIIGAIASLIIGLIDSIRILTTDYKNKELNDEKLIWGVLGLIILGNIACLVFAIKMVNVAEAGIDTKTNDPVNETTNKIE